MNNLVYAKDQSIFPKAYVEKAYRTYMENAAFRAGLMQLDHAKDMGVSKHGGRFPITADLYDDFDLPPSYKTWLLDGPMKGREIKVTRVTPGMELKIPDSRRYQIHTYRQDKLGRYFFHRTDDMGVEGMFMQQNELLSLDAKILTQDPSNNKEALMGTATKETTKSATEKPIQQQPVKLAVYFRVNGMPQELTQKQANEHVAKLLSLGAAEVGVVRYIRDETSRKFTNAHDHGY